VNKGDRVTGEFLADDLDPARNHQSHGTIFVAPQFDDYSHLVSTRLKHEGLLVE